MVLILISCAQSTANAQQDDFVLRTEQLWDTYGIGGTCIPGTHDLTIADVDADGTNEIITGGFSYLLTNNTRANIEAPLRIMSWTGQDLIFEKKENWAGNIWVVYTGDADGDGKTEILTLGTVADNNRSLSALRFWNWDGNSIVLRGTFFNVSASSIFVNDFDKDGKMEIATVGRSTNASAANAQLNIWAWDGTNLELLKSETWHHGDSSQANSVYAFDLNNDGIQEIVTAGYDNGIKNSSGQLRVWQWDGANLNLKSNVEWRLIENSYALDVAGNPMGNTIAHNVKIAEIDNDGVPEIVTGGFTFNGTQVCGQLRIWNWKDNNLNLEKSQEWTTYDITELKSIAINDVDKDGKPEIVTSGVTAGRGAFAENATIKELAQLRVWKWSGTNLALDRSKDWIVDDGVCAWQDGTSDLDNDGAVEIVTVGCSYLQTLCDPNLRIWSFPTSKSAEGLPSTYAIVAVAAVVVAIGVVIVIKTRKKQT